MNQNHIPVFTPRRRPRFIAPLSLGHNKHNYSKDSTMWATGLRKREVSNGSEAALPQTVFFDGNWCVYLMEPNEPVNNYALFTECSAGQTASFRHCPCLLCATDGYRPFNGPSLRPCSVKCVFFLLHTSAVETHNRIQHNWMHRK